MSNHKVNHSVIRWIDAVDVVKGSQSTTSEWIDTNGWTDKKISVEGDVTDGSGRSH